MNTAGVKILSLQGTSLKPADPAKNTSAWINPQQGCIVSKYLFSGTDAQPDWDQTCEEYRDGVATPSLEVVSAQVRQMIMNAGPISLLTGHSLGCAVALSEGLIHGIPVVCFSTSGSFTKAWRSNYPGLETAISQQMDKSTPGAHFTLQTYTDLQSNCLKPQQTNIVPVCSFSGPSPSCNGKDVTPSYNNFSPCARDAHWVDDILTVPQSFKSDQCSFTDQSSVAVGCAN